MNILVIAPHTDDETLGAGGSIARWVEEGNEVDCLTFSVGYDGIGSNGVEHLNALGVLGVVGQFGIGNYQTRYFHERRQDVLSYFFEFEYPDKYDLVLVPSRANIHQDHEVVTAEAMRAFRTCSILGYEMPWGDVRPFNPQFYVRLEHRHVNKKLRALDCYKSQKERDYMHDGVVVSQMRVRGMQVGARYAEAFEVIRWVT